MMRPLPQTFIPEEPLFYEAQAKPYDIDKQLRSIIHSPDLAPRLDVLLHRRVSRIGASSFPQSHNDTARHTGRYQSCLLVATMLGRAYTMVAPDPIVDADQATDVLSKAASSLPYELILFIYEDHLANLRTRQALWTAISFIFVKAFFSSPSADPGALYAAAVLLLTCGKALGRTPCLAGRGTQWDWFDGRFEEPDRIFRWRDIVDAAMKRELSPQHNTDSRAVSGRPGEAPRAPQRGVEYVSQEIFDMFRAARAHLLDAERKDDWTTAEVLDRFLLKPKPEIVVGSAQLTELENGM